MTRIGFLDAQAAAQSRTASPGIHRGTRKPAQARKTKRPMPPDIAAGHAATIPRPQNDHGAQGAKEKEARPSAADDAHRTRRPPLFGWGPQINIALGHGPRRGDKSLHAPGIVGIIRSATGWKKFFAVWRRRRVLEPSHNFRRVIGAFMRSQGCYSCIGPPQRIRARRKEMG